MTIKLSLYTTSHCHLCEQAQALLISAAHHHDIELSIIEIADDQELLSLYEIKIPVLKRLDIGTEICWPFSIDAIDQLLGSAT